MVSLCRLPVIPTTLWYIQGMINKFGPIVVTSIQKLWRMQGAGLLSLFSGRQIRLRWLSLDYNWINLYQFIGINLFINCSLYYIPFFFMNILRIPPWGSITMAIMTFQGDGIERISEDTIQLGLVGCWWKERNTGIDCIDSKSSSKWLVNLVSNDFWKSPVSLWCVYYKRIPQVRMASTSSIKATKRPLKPARRSPLWGNKAHPMDQQNNLP